MYVCVCHAFTDKQVRKALSEGARNTASVYKSLGHKVQCGKCVPYVRGMVEEHRQATFGAPTACAGGGNCGCCTREHDHDHDHDHGHGHGHGHAANEDTAVAYGVAAE